MGFYDKRVIARYQINIRNRESYLVLGVRATYVQPTWKFRATCHLQPFYRSTS